MCPYAAFSFRTATHGQITGLASDLFSLPKICVNRYNISNWAYPNFLDFSLFSFSYPWKKKMKNDK